MRLPMVLLTLILAATCRAQPQQPNVTAQREAMKKLEFLAGKWSGDAAITRGPGQPMKIRQSENIQYKLDGLVLLIEGTGRNAEGQIAFQAMATISFDDQSGAYKFRSHSDGRYLETELRVAGKGFEWGYTAGQLKVANVMRINEKGEWVETTEAAFGANPPRRSVEMTLQKQP